MIIKLVEEFKASLSSSEPPNDFDNYNRSLWWAAKGDWEKAHDLIQDLEDSKAYKIHAYLHRLEGDPSNAAYWYSKAGTRMPKTSLSDEWNELVRICYKK